MNDTYDGDGGTTLDADAVAQCRAVIVHHSKSFAMASRVLPAGVRDEAWIVYAWCRRADDAVDETSAAERGPALERLRRELDLVYGPELPQDPILRAFQQVVRRRDIPRSYPEELLAGMAMDVHDTRYQTLGDLLRYCYRAAGTVGLMMCHVMGVRREGALANAAHLGMAMQLTNVCRDVAEDWERGRLYVPTQWLADEGVGWMAAARRRGPLPGDVRPALAMAVAHLLDEADVYYRSGDRGLDALSWRCALAIRTARAVYADIGRVLRARGCDVAAGRAVVSRPRKLWLLACSLWRSVLEAPRRTWRALWARRRPRLPARTVEYPADVLIGRAGGE